MSIVAVWLLVIGGVITSDGYPPSMSNEMFADKESCHLAQNHMSINSDYRKDLMRAPKVSCIKVNILVAK